ncbi:MAG: patatin-like phospholipase family protein [Vicinamibacterales bacterium]
MTLSGAGPSPDGYSPERRTALLLTGTGTAGVYHAGVLRALHEAGVKIDLVAGRGVGAIGALFAAVDGAQRLWDDSGFWRSAGTARLYPWRGGLRTAAQAFVLAALIVLLPLATVAFGLVVYPIDFLLKMAGMSGGGMIAWYAQAAEAAFAPTALPTWLPRLALLAIAAAVAALFTASFGGGGVRHARGPWWWRLLPAPLEADTIVARTWSAVWDLVRGAAHLQQPPRVDLARRYAEILLENLGQPGFRELVLVVHDIDAKRDLVLALVAETNRRGLVRRPSARDTDRRRAEVFDLAGVSRDYLADAVAAALTVPLATEPHLIRFTPDAYWRGETHRLCDRPGSVERLIAELEELGVEQIVFVTAAPDAEGPHALAHPRVDLRGRLGEYARSSESSVLFDALDPRREGEPRIFVIRPLHNPVGVFDFDGGFDDRSDRRLNLNELMSRGYEDAYHQFIEPVVGASGERVGGL